jgi:hypothetical protein
LWPYAVGFLVVIGIVLLLQRRRSQRSK